MPELDYLIAPELQPRRLRHSEAVDVEDSAANAELGDVLDHRHALEPDLLEMLGEPFRTPRVAFAYLETGRLQRARELRSLQQRAAGGDDDSDGSGGHSLQGLNALPRDFGVRLRLAETFARRIKGDRPGIAGRRCLIHELRQIGQPPLCAGHVVRHDHDQPGRDAA